MHRQEPSESRFGSGLRRWARLGGWLLGLAAALTATAAGSPVRVVSQTVGSDELLLALAEPAQVAALSHLARDPNFSTVAEEARKYPQIQIGDAETILRFAPTLVLVANYSRADLVVQVQRAGVRTLRFENYRTIEDAYANLRLLARELGAEARAEALIAQCQGRVEALQQRLRGVRPVRVVAPSVYGLIPGAGTTFQDLCDHAGAENLGCTLGGLVGDVSAPGEKMLTWPVERLVLMGDDRATALAPFRDLLPYRLMPVVREGRAVVLPACLMSCITHHRIEAYERLARQLHPEAFR